MRPYQTFLHAVVMRVRQVKHLAICSGTFEPAHDDMSVMTSELHEVLV